MPDPLTAVGVLALVGLAVLMILAPVTPPEEKYPPAIRSVMKLGGEAFGADSPEFAEWLQAQGIPTVQVLEMLNPEALTKLADKLGAMVAKKQAGANDQDSGDDVPY